MEAEESHIWSLITRRLSGEATEAECEELKELLRAQPSWQYAYEMLRNWWGREEDSGSTDNAKRSLTRMKERAGLEKGRPARGESDVVQLLPAENKPSFKEGNSAKWVSGAAVVLFLICIGLYFLPRSGTGTISGGGHTPPDGLSEVSTRYGSKSRAKLPDGTLVWLNSGSKLTYDNDQFGSTTREITLTGEAFFDVKQDADHPFIIHAGRINIRVLGTAFDVKSYPEDNTSEATLIRGAIEVLFADQPGKKVRLKPHQKLVVYKDDRMIAQSLDTSEKEVIQGYKVSPMTFIPKDSVVVETSWVQNKLAFRSETFADLATQMERWYNVKINFTGSQVKQYRFTGIFMNESLEEALQALQITAPFHYRIEQNEIFISKP